MKLDEAKLLDAMAEVSAKTCGEWRAIARAFCVELARQVAGQPIEVQSIFCITREADVRSCMSVSVRDLEAAFLPPKREPDVEAAVAALMDILCCTTCATIGGANVLRQNVDRALRALGEDV